MTKPSKEETCEERNSLKIIYWRFPFLDNSLCFKTKKRIWSLLLHVASRHPNAIVDFDPRSYDLFVEYTRIKVVRFAWKVNCLWSYTASQQWLFRVWTTDWGISLVNGKDGDGYTLRQFNIIRSVSKDMRQNKEKYTRHDMKRRKTLSEHDKKRHEGRRTHRHNDHHHQMLTVFPRDFINWMTRVGAV